MNLKDQKNLLLMIQRAQNPVNIRAYNFFTFSLPTFTQVGLKIYSAESEFILYILQVVHSSYSYFTMLNRVFGSRWLDLKCSLLLEISIQKVLALTIINFKVVLNQIYLIHNFFSYTMPIPCHEWIILVKKMFFRLLLILIYFIITINFFNWLIFPSSKNLHPQNQNDIFSQTHRNH